MTLPSVRGAFLIHFGISLLIFLVLTALMIFIWYPGDLFMMDGGWQGLKIIAPIDLILGPALTLCFYRPWKKNVKFDLSVIAAVQLLALGYGIAMAYQQRPAAIVFAENRFETLSLAEYKSATKEMRENDLEPKSLKEFGTKMPVVVHAHSFANDDYGQYLADVMNGLPELRERSDRYSSIKQAKDDIAEYRIGAQEGGTTIEVTASSKSEAKPMDTAEIYPLKARYIDGTIEFDPADFEWIKITRNKEED